MVTPQYQVQTTIWIESATPMQTAGGGPIRSAELVNENAWVELFLSYRISDAVVRKLGLYLTPKNTADAPLFKGFTLADSLVATPACGLAGASPAHARRVLSLLREVGNWLADVAAEGTLG